MTAEPIVIYSAASAQQAYLLKSLLEEQGIAAWVVNDAIQLAGGELPLGWTAAAKVVVRDYDALEARAVVDKFEMRTGQPSATGDDEALAAPEDWAAWPHCPHCGERRSARCPVCTTSGSRFPLADWAEGDAGSERVFLVCAACDDHFLPEWHRHCARCGHDFGGGVEAAAIPAVAEFSFRSALVLAAMLVSAVAFFGYFVWLFSLRAG